MDVVHPQMEDGDGAELGRGGEGRGEISAGMERHGGSEKCEKGVAGLTKKEASHPPLSLSPFLHTCRTGGGAPPPRTADGPAPRMWVRKAATREGLVL